MTKKELKKLFSRKEVVFTAVAYPALIITGYAILYFASTWAFQHPQYYSFMVFFSCGVITICFLLELVMKTIGYKMQGDKLRLRQREGIDITEIKEINRGNRNT